MTKVDVENIIALCGGMEQFRSNIKEFVLDNTKRVDATNIEKDPHSIQHFWIDMEKELLFNIAKTGYAMEIIVTPFDCIQNIVLRYASFKHMDAIFNIKDQLDPRLIANLEDNSIGLTTC